ncbi:MAG: hypothetical protein AAGG68_08925 [Bacteroidota bacterium]
MAKKHESNTPKTRQQVAEEYGICYKTLMRRLKKLSIILPKGLLFAKQQKHIYEQLGYPNSTNEDPPKDG